MTLKEITLPACGAYLYESKHKEGDRVSEHYHRIHQILYAIEGEGSIFISDKKYEIMKDQAVFLTPNTLHSVISHSSLTLLVLAFDIEQLGSDHNGELQNPIFHDSYFFHPDLIASSELRQIIRKMLYEQTSESPFSNWSLKIHLLHLLITIARLKERSLIQDKNSYRNEKIKHYIDTYYFEPITSREIASKLGISTRYLNSIFKEQYQKTPIQYLTEVRIEVAKKLLNETSKEIITICFEVGYETVSTFYRSFKNIMNMSPNQYRNMIQLSDKVDET